jgi:tyrosyl-DNA phosphodiesterase-1
MKRESQPVIVIIDDSENDDNSEDDAKPPSRPRKQQRTATSASSLEPPPSAAPMKLFCTLSDEAERRAHTDKNHWSRSQCWTLREMLGYDKNSNDDSNSSASTARHIEWLVISNFMINFEYLLDEIPELLSIPKVVVFYGTADTSEPWKAACGDAVDFVQLNPSDPLGQSNPTGQRIPYGVHHSKFFLVGYSDSTVRVIIHTANLLYGDIRMNAQAAYIQDFPMKQGQKKQQQTNGNRDASSSSSSSFGSPTASDFEETLVAYLDTYRYHKPHAWVPTTAGGTAAATNGTERLTDLIRRYDFSTASAVLLPSTPGYHRLDAAQPVGHHKLRQAVIHNTTTKGSEKNRPIICQFSSIGSLSDKYLHELQTSMDTGLARESKQSVSDAPIRLQLVYPTVADIRHSMQGYRGGGSVPGTTKNVSKPFLQSLYRKWSSTTAVIPNPLWKSRNVPHIKTYYQLNHEGCSMDWFVVTSHNMSKAAWGEVQNSRHGSRRLFIRHWELVSCVELFT